MGIDAKTVKSYYEILVDTLIGNLLEPYSERRLGRKDLLTYPKFYLFDSGVVSYLRKVELKKIAGVDAGQLFEGYIFHELKAYLGYSGSRCELRYVKSHSGFEVDFLTSDGRVLIETTISERVRKEDLKGLNHFAKDFPHSRKIAVCLERERRNITQDGVKIEIYPFTTFLEELWGNAIIGSYTVSKN